MTRRRPQRRSRDRSSAATVWPLVHAERRALIADLEGVDAAAWTAPSACAGWSVRDVVAHLVDNARTTRRGFVVEMVRARLDLDRANASGVLREGGRTPQQMLARLREVAARTSTPPVALGSRLAEEVVHGEDVRRPLGITRRYPVEAVTRALEVQAATPGSFGGAKEMLTRVRLVADDAPAALGAGPVVTGPLLALLLLASGRHGVVDQLAGPGLAVLVASRRDD